MTAGINHHLASKADEAMMTAETGHLGVANARTGEKNEITADTARLLETGADPLVKKEVKAHMGKTQVG